MPITAAQIVRRTRELVQMIEGTNKSFRDGFATDTDVSDTDLIPILPSVTDFMNLCSVAGAKPRDVAIPVIVSQRDYDVPTDVSAVIQVYFNGFPLTETSRESLDRSTPSWILLTGTPQRWFTEGDRIVLDRITNSGGLMSWRCAMSLDLFDGTNPTDTNDPALSDTQVLRVPYGAAYLLMNIDAMNQAHKVRLQGYKSIADGLLNEIQGSTSHKDYSRRISLDDYIPEQQEVRSFPQRGMGDLQQVNQ